MTHNTTAHYTYAQQDKPKPKKANPNEMKGQWLQGSVAFNKYISLALKVAELVKPSTELSLHCNCFRL